MKVIDWNLTETETLIFHRQETNLIELKNSELAWKTALNKNLISTIQIIFRILKSDKKVQNF
jgi:hypothetical protein